MNPDNMLKDAMKIVLPKLGLDPDTQYTLSSITANLWLSSVSRVTMETPEAVTVVVKRPPGSEAQDFFDSDIFFRNETGAYTTVLPVLIDLQRDAGLVRDIFNDIPRCLLALCEGGGRDIVVLEDMVARGFSQVPRKTGLVLNEGLIVARTLGRLHALSVVLRCKLSPEEFASFTSNVSETVFCAEHVAKTAGLLWKHASNFAVQMLSSELPGGECGKYAQKLKQVADNAITVLKEPSLTVSKNEPHNVICHGDHYTNNFMFKYVNSVPQEVCLLDWQQCRYASPATDLSSLLYLAMEYPGRHHDELLDEYTNSMTNMLQRFHLPTALFTRSDVDQQLKKYGKYGVAIAFLNVPHSLRHSEEENLQVSEIQNVAEKVAEQVETMSTRARQKLLDIVCDAVDRGYL